MFGSFHQFDRWVRTEQCWNWAQVKIKFQKKESLQASLEMQLMDENSLTAWKIVSVTSRPREDPQNQISTTWIIAGSFSIGVVWAGGDALTCKSWKMSNLHILEYAYMQLSSRCKNFKTLSWNLMKVISDGYAYKQTNKRHHILKQEENG